MTETDALMLLVGFVWLLAFLDALAVWLLAHLANTPAHKDARRRADLGDKWWYEA